MLIALSISKLVECLRYFWGNSISINYFEHSGLSLVSDNTLDLGPAYEYTTMTHLGIIVLSLRSNN